jgi:hypothetical protein
MVAWSLGMAMKSRKPNPKAKRGHPFRRLAPFASGEDHHDQRQQHGQHHPVDQVASAVILVLPAPRTAYRVKDEVPDGQPDEHGGPGPNDVGKRAALRFLAGGEEDGADDLRTCDHHHRERQDAEPIHRFAPFGLILS